MVYYNLYVYNFIHVFFYFAQTKITPRPITKTDLVSLDGKKVTKASTQ